MLVSGKNKTALVTGASSGIGEELCELLAADGHDLVVVARRRERLESLATRLSSDHGVKVSVIAKDLAAAGAAREVCASLDARDISVDVLVNSAGFGDFADVAGADQTKLGDMMQVNVVALTELTRLLVPGMRERGSGRILNIGSTAGFFPGPGMAVYYASKAYVNSFTEALATELAGSGVTATVLCPGPVATEFQAEAHLEDSRFVKLAPMQTSEMVARAGYSAMNRGKVMEVPGLQYKLLPQLTRFSPRVVIRSVVRFLQTP